MIDAQHKVQYRRVAIGMLQEDGLRVISQGLKPSEWVVVSGLQQVRLRMQVQLEQMSMPSYGPAAGGQPPPVPAEQKPQAPVSRGARKIAAANDGKDQTLVRNKPTAYGRATLGAKPFRRAPFPTRCEQTWIGGNVETVGWHTECDYREPGAKAKQVVRVTFALRIPAPTGPSIRVRPALRGKPNPRPTGVVDYFHQTE